MNKLQGKKILLLEDSADNARLLEIFLKMEGAQMDWYESAEDVLSKVDDLEGYDVVLSDITLPGMNGLEFCQKAKGWKVFSETPFIAMSGHGNEDSISEKAGFNLHLTKPVEPNDLVEQICKLTR